MNNAIGYVLFEFGTGNLRNHAIIVILVTQYPFLLKTVHQRHVKQRRQSLCRLSGNGIRICIQHITLTIVCQRCHHGYHSFMNQISQQRSIYLLHIAHETIINLFHRTLHRSDHIHIRPGQSKSVHSTGLQPGNDILVYQTAIHHRYHFQCFRIGNTTAIYHFAFNT